MGGKFRRSERTLSVELFNFARLLIGVENFEIMLRRKLIISSPSMVRLWVQIAPCP